MYVSMLFQSNVSCFTFCILNSMQHCILQSTLEFHFEHYQSPAAGGDVMAANIPKEWIYAKTLHKNTDKFFVLEFHEALRDWQNISTRLLSEKEAGIITVPVSLLCLKRLKPQAEESQHSPLADKLSIPWWPL